MKHDLDHDPSTSVLNLDLDIMVTYMQKMKSTGKNNGIDMCGLDFDLMTLILLFVLDIIVTYLHTINEVCKSNGSKAMA